MFIVLNRQKIYSYIISIATVCMLFVIAGNINTGKNAITTSAPTRQLPIYNVRTDEKIELIFLWFKADFETVKRQNIVEKCRKIAQNVGKITSKYSNLYGFLKLHMIK